MMENKHPHHISSFISMQQLSEKVGRANVFVVRDCFFDKTPKHRPVIELFQMTEFVDDDVVRGVGRQKYNFVVEAQRAFAGATPPPRFLVAHAHAVETNVVQSVPVLDAIIHKFLSSGFVIRVANAVALPHLGAKMFEGLKFGEHPVGFACNKLLDHKFAQTLRPSDDKTSIAIHIQPHALGAAACFERVFDVGIFELDFSLHWTKRQATRASSGQYIAGGAGGSS